MVALHGGGVLMEAVELARLAADVGFGPVALWLLYRLESRLGELKGSLDTLVTLQKEPDHGQADRRRRAA
jgi:hypothetical protein